MPRRYFADEQPIKSFMEAAMRYVLFLDDRRHPTDVIPGHKLSRYHSDGLFLIWAKDVEMAKWYVEDPGLPEFVWFDHDLGECLECENTGRIGPCFCPHCGGKGGMTSMDWLNWLRDQTDLCQKFKPFDYIIHSANPTGAKNIEAFMNSWYKSKDP